jgi:hypothetical protein
MKTPNITMTDAAVTIVDNKQNSSGYKISGVVEIENFHTVCCDLRKDKIYKLTTSTKLFARFLRWTINNLP